MHEGENEAAITARRFRRSPLNSARCMGTIGNWCPESTCKRVRLARPKVRARLSNGTHAIVSAQKGWATAARAHLSVQITGLGHAGEMGRKGSLSTEPSLYPFSFVFFFPFLFLNFKFEFNCELVLILNVQIEHTNMEEIYLFIFFIWYSIFFSSLSPNSKFPIRS
jgi:hypothetical protein